LLELILALVLMSTMMAVVWAMMGAFRNRLESSQRRIERSTLIRSIQQRIERDLRSCIVPTTEESAHGDSGTSPDVRPVIGVTALSRNPLSTILDVDPSQPVTADSTGSTFAATSAMSDSSTNDSQVGQAPGIPSDWLSPDTFLLGSSTYLIFDATIPAGPEEDLPSDLTRSLPSANTPDVTRRVVYLFINPATALRTGQSGGLIRCPLTSRQLAILRADPTGSSDILEVIRPVLDALGFVPASNSARGRPDSADPPILAGPDNESASDNDSAGHAWSAHADEIRRLATQLDYVPEIRTFLFRYFDGETWRMNWDTRQQNALPVAMELRFHLDEVLSPAEPRAEFAEDDFPVSPPSVNEIVPPAESMVPKDDRMYSAQSRPPDDHRYLIYLRLPTPPHPGEPIP
jgi:hypothetical protein